MQGFESSDRVDRTATAEDVIRYTKPITTATAKAVAAGNSCRQEDIISASNTGRKVHTRTSSIILALVYVQMVLHKVESFRSFSSLPVS